MILKTQNTLCVAPLKPKRGRLNSNPNPETGKKENLNISRRTACPVGDYAMNFESSSTVSTLKLCRPLRSKTVRSAKLGRATQKRISKHEIKQFFNELFIDENERDAFMKGHKYGSQMGNRKLKAKMDYFYTAYNTEKCITPYMQFEEKMNDTAESRQEKPFYKTAQHKWTNISNNVLNKNAEYFREFLQAVNNEMYTDLIKFGKKYCAKITLPKSVNGRRQSGVPNSDHSEKQLNHGIKMLKEVIRDKIINKRRNVSIEIDRNTQTDNTAKHDILSSLLCISRGNTKPKLTTERVSNDVESFRNLKKKVNGKHTTKLNLTPFSKLIDPLNIKKTYKNLCSKEIIKSVERTTRRRKSLFKFLHSEKQIPKIKPNHNCLGCLTSRTKIKKNQKRVKSIAVTNKKPRRSLNIMIRKNPGKKLSYRPKLRVITDKNICLTSEKDTKDTHMSNEESSNSIESSSVGSYRE